MFRHRVFPAVQDGGPGCGDARALDRNREQGAGEGGQQGTPPPEIVSKQIGGCLCVRSQGGELANRGASFLKWEFAYRSVILVKGRPWRRILHFSNVCMHVRLDGLSY